MIKVSKEQLREMIREALLEQDAKDPKAPYGRYLFGPDQRNPKAKAEENTDKEEELEYQLSTHYGGQTANDELGKQLLRTVKPQLQKGNYTKIFNPPKGTVYRGMALNPGDFSALVNMDVSEIHEDPYRGWYVGTNGIVKPRGDTKLATMSWTTNPQTAISFALPGARTFSGNVYAVFTAKTNEPGNNFFVNPDIAPKQYKSGPFKIYEREKEVISVGPVKFTDVAFYYDNKPNIEPVAKAIKNFIESKVAPQIKKMEKSEKALAKLNNPRWEINVSNMTALVKMFSPEMMKILTDGGINGSKQNSDNVLVMLFKLYNRFRDLSYNHDEAVKRTVDYWEINDIFYRNAEIFIKTNPKTGKAEPPKNPRQALLYALGVRSTPPTSIKKKDY